MTETADDDEKEVQAERQLADKKRLASNSPPHERAVKERKQASLACDSLDIVIETPTEYRQRKPVAVQAPTQVTSFSFDETRTLHHDDRSRRYYHAPPRRADLNYGFERRTERDERINEHLDALLASLKVTDERQTKDQRVSLHAHVITWRGMMTRLCTLLYEMRDGFEMNAMLVGDTLYVEEHVGVKRKAEKEREAKDERRMRFGYYGYSFESYCCHAWRTWRHDREAWDGDVNTNVQWCSVVKTRLDDVRLLLGGEVDAVDAERTNELVEVKTSMHIRNARDEERFEQKMLRFYMQSFLLGVRRIVVGFRDPRGVLVTHQEMDTLAMPRAVRGKPHAWDPQACLAVAADVLSKTRQHIRQHTPFASYADLPSLDKATKSDAYPVYRITYDPTASPKRVTVARLPSSEVLSEVKEGCEEGRVGFLSGYYYEFVRDGLQTG